MRPESPIASPDVLDSSIGTYRTTIRLFNDLQASLLNSISKGSYERGEILTYVDMDLVAVPVIDCVGCGLHSKPIFFGDGDSNV